MMLPGGEGTRRLQSSYLKSFQVLVSPAAHRVGARNVVEVEYGPRPFAPDRPNAPSPPPLAAFVCTRTQTTIPDDVGTPLVEDLALSGWGYANFRSVVNFALTAF